jgi:hypothetical protein
LKRSELKFCRISSLIFVFYVVCKSNNTAVATGAPWSREERMCSAIPLFCSIILSLKVCVSFIDWKTVRIAVDCVCLCPRE